MPSFTDPGPIELDATIFRGGEVANASSFVAIPAEVVARYGARGRIPVVATFDEAAPYRGSMSPMGGRHLLLVLREVQERIGKTAGDAVHLRLELDTAPRRVELATDVEAALLAGDALDAFRAVSFSHQRQYALWIESAKRAETRAARIATTVDEVRRGELSR